ncbi:MAG: TRAM domain-containing protein [Thermoproteota archaeon]|nr:TRAM domain-containing protein [Thermoproteota archaeon]
MPSERRGRRFSRRGFAPKPVELGKEYDVEIQETSRRGDGVARIQGLVIFVPGAKKGQNVRVKITKVSRRFAEGEVVSKAEETVEEE